MFTKMGNHYTLDIHNIPFGRLNDGPFLETVLKNAVGKSGATVLNTVRHYFSPQGVTIILLLAESHASLHTYPELGYAAFDFFTCGDTCEPHKSIDYILSFFEKDMVDCTFHKIDRGYNDGVGESPYNRE